MNATPLRLALLLRIASEAGRNSPSSYFHKLKHNYISTDLRWEVLLVDITLSKEYALTPLPVKRARDSKLNITSTCHFCAFLL